MTRSPHHFSARHHSHRNPPRPRGRWWVNVSATLMALLLVLAAGSQAAAAGTMGSPRDNARLAAERLVQWYNPNSGTYNTTGWWNAAIATTALIDYTARSGDRQFLDEIDNTWTKGRTAVDGDFRNLYLDDTGWWGIAWMNAYDLTGDPKYLETAKIDAEHMESWRTDKCGGGVVWATNSTYKNAVTNEVFMQLSAGLYNRTGEQKYLDRAIIVWDWLTGSGMINDENLVNDGLNGWTCTNNGQTTWTYNQGVILGASVELWKATGDQKYLDQGVKIADAVTTSPHFTKNGILTELCEASATCTGNTGQFKGIFIRNLDLLDRALPDRPYRGFIQRQATTIPRTDLAADGSYGLYWTGPVDLIKVDTHTAGLQALIAGIAG